ncbi:MAG: glycerol-3-phosphate 1-O-acyltransferase PlsY [Exiguobacterium sp.]|uniref:glycerol-3-phosphate 1-O-acyltransferase PlsY n=1 Tax=Exiguobacterium sp. AB2 TaxID=1484479 RepID=UPI0004A8BA30|nr:glycerol-3-phosphate 1-O-acyltransferase PlsY [Exiguobacterium sp. AB2]KDN58965.1 glycerol-3-phosphate acyltransferase [Exiguobacterium sp. AB2]MDX5322576.1 glycerol-3-phosphate 1-O-acyltransferase PlsY [Exiguobacterium sp.]MDX5424302.1 glycerol-3-phosphate 1-O-acyltransferase PlsY [Exiguobacterium sp.]MDX6771821.1 glycerol-3-phosphate 1-O-acyltransferase PlsY [Exiguobacterium sp.]
MPYLTEIFIVLISYLLGAVPFALIIGKLGYRVDVREHGSGNLGTTNTFRVLGKRAGTLVLLGDMGKGLLAALLPLLFGSDMSLLLAGIPAIIGHSYPIFAKFKGGKSVATSAGVLLAAFPWFFLVVVSTFLLTLMISKMVSLSSMAASAVGLVTVTVYGLMTRDWLPLVVIVPLALFIIIKHRSNWQRIRSGTEPKVPLFQKRK